MDDLLKPSPPFVAGLTQRIAIAKATAVAKIRIKQFLAIPLAGKVVAPCPVKAMPLCVLYRVLLPRSRTAERRQSPLLKWDEVLKKLVPMAPSRHTNRLLAFVAVVKAR